MRLAHARALALRNDCAFRITSIALDRVRRFRCHLRMPETFSPGESGLEAYPKVCLASVYGNTRQVGWWHIFDCRFLSCERTCFARGIRAGIP